ncbi:SDR family NAD(P)-dependent oxidoreductase, partial [Dactylosporangium sp. NPDC048998]|uniref:SDR family NAD(P)-dependent oxidoreductase n=1 Tax=Dactylosporangium sp. NPDC048998 TaxID=3363976 RepID=UPI00371EE392
MEPTRTADLTATGLTPTEHPLLSAVVPVAGGDDVLFSGRLSMQRQRWLTDHRVGDVVLVPGSALTDALVHVGGWLGVPVVEELTIAVPIVLDETTELDVQVAVDEPADDGRRAVRLYTRAGSTAKWTEHAAGYLAVALPDPVGSDHLRVWPPAGARSVDVGGLYDRLPVAYGPAFRALRAAWVAAGRVYAEVALPEEAEDADDYGVHPVLLDAVLHPLGESGFFADPDRPRLAFSWTGVRVHATGARVLRACLTPAGPDGVAVSAVDELGAPVLDVAALVVRPADPANLRPAGGSTGALYAVDWVPAPPATAAAPEWAYLEDVRDSAAPAVVVLRPAATDSERPVPGQVHEAGLALVDVLRDWLTDPRWAQSRLVLLTRPSDLVQQSLWGLVRAAQSENPGRFGLLETDRDEAVTVTAGLAASTDEPQVAVRDGKVLLARLTRVTGAARAEETSPLANGVVLVTGATGGLGRLVTEHLVRVHRVPELLLVSRSGAPQEWLDELTALGAAVRAVAADVADREALAELVGEVADRLVGVVHVAGIVDDAVVPALTPQRWNAVLRPKVDAVWHLHELTAGLDLAAFVVYSSASSTFGGAGQGNYAAGNAFLDAFAGYRRGLGLPATALAWGLWAEEAGMGGRLSDVDLARMARGGTLPMSAADGLALFDAALVADRPALVPIRLDLAAVRARGDVHPLLRALVPAGLRRGGRAGQADSSFGSRIAALSPAERAEALLTLVRTQAATVLGHPGPDAIDPRRAFKELGFDSLTAVEFRNRLGAATGLRLPATLVFNYPSPVAVADHLAVELVAAVPAAPAVMAPAVSPVDDDPIAIVAMACRFPGGLNSPEELWRFVRDGGDAVGPLPTDRGWDVDGLYDPDPDAVGHSYVRTGGFIDVAGFDAEFFGISPREALAMDPQQRLLLEVSW